MPLWYKAELGSLPAQRDKRAWETSRLMSLWYRYIFTGWKQAAFKFFDQVAEKGEIGSIYEAKKRPG